MLSWLAEILNNPAFMPHGHCFLWTPNLLTLFVVADSLIALSYFAIPVALLYFMRRRTDFPYKGLLCLFGSFITLCGITHLLSLWNIWNASYWLEAWLKLLTGVVSAATAITIFPVLPRALSLPSHKDMAQANAALQDKVAELEITQGALRKSEQRYRQLVEIAQEGIWVFDQRGTTTFVNQRMSQMLGYTPQELEGHSMLEFVAPNSRAALLDKLGGKSEDALGAGKAIGDEHSYGFHRRDGSLMYAIFSTSPVLDGSGVQCGILSVVTDITEREKATRGLSEITAKLEQLVTERTEALAQANTWLMREVAMRAQTHEHLQAILNAAADGIIVADQSGQILATNPAVEKIFQYKAKETLGQPLSMLMPEPFRHEHESYIGNYLQTGHAKIIGIGREVLGLRRDGSEFPLDLAVGEIRNEDGVQFVGIVRDISERKAQQEQILMLNEKLSNTNAELQTQISAREQALRAVDIANEKLENTLVELREHSENTSLLNEMSELLQAALDLPEVGAIIELYCTRLFAADAGNLLFVEEDKHTLLTVFAWGDAAECESEIIHHRCWALRQARPYPSTHLQRSLRCPHLHMQPERETICLPLFGQGAPLGLLALRGDAALSRLVSHRGRTPPAWLQAFIEQVSLAVANIRLRERLHDESIRDPLTGLFNRRHLDQELKRIWTLLERTDHVLALMMIDIDHFKRVNDNYGHNIGDLVLSDVAHHLQRMSRPGDVLARFGGEEFVIVLPGASLEVAKRRAVDICNDLAHAAIRRPNGEDLSVTVSIGVAACRHSDKGSGITQLIMQADQALYQAKEGGRNCVKVYLAEDNGGGAI